MLCMNCGAQIQDSVYCPVCGCDVSVQKQAIVLSGLYYNQGLEKARIRDLSGAEDQLRRSLKFNKLNIPARNLLGLVYFELGEVVQALSEWVISENLKPEENLATAYIANLKQDANRLDVINQTIKKFNIALRNVREGNEDVAMIQLRKILAQNPKLIKGYHLLALLYIKHEEYDRARKLLKRALGIDKTNTTTLRYLREIEEETGVPNEPTNVRGGRRKEEEALYEEKEQRAQDVIRAFFLRRGVIALLGALLGACLIAFLILPARIRAINQTANEKITSYSAQTAAQNSTIQELQEQIEQSRSTVDNANAQVDAANIRANSYEQLVYAIRAYNREAYEDAAVAMADVTPSSLSEDALSVYQSMLGDVSEFLFIQLKQKGLANLSRGDYAAAVAAFERAKEIDDTDEEVLLSLTESQTRLAAQQSREREEARKASAESGQSPVISADEITPEPVSPEEEATDAAQEEETAQPEDNG